VLRTICTNAADIYNQINVQTLDELKTTQNYMNEFTLDLVERYVRT